MKTSSVLRVALAIIFAGAIGSAVAQNGAHDKPAAAHHENGHENGNGVLRLLPADSVTEHSIDTAAGKLAYTATAGTLPFYDQSGERSASIFYTAYIVKNAGGKSAGAKRPLTFVFNGGPGAASAFLHLGLVGPRILDLGPDGRDAAHGKIRDNPDTWLRFTDLVLIDPIGTGWSRTVKPDDAKHFYGVRADADAMAKAIALYIAKNNRTDSPKYLFGESYGGFRAAKVARALQREQGINTAGIVMLSPMLEGWLTFGDDESALRAALELPSLAAAALERKNTFSADALAAAEKFAMTDYLTTLAGASPQGEAGRAFYGKVAQMSGLPLDVVTKARGFITSAYINSLQSGKIVSRYDATFAVDNPYPESQSAQGSDPILDGMARAYGGAMADYARNELGFKTEMTYVLLSDAVRHWDWQGGRLQASAEDDLRVLLAFDRSFRLLIAHGYSDMVTPFGMTRYVLNHLPPTDPPRRAQLKLYRGGHMLYLDAASRKAFSADAGAFYRTE
jgi:carboxypeptidase C (cathepsin A)